MSRGLGDVYKRQILEDRNEDNRKEDQTKTSHKLLHALGFTTVGIKKFSDKHCKTGTAS